MPENKYFRLHIEVEGETLKEYTHKTPGLEKANTSYVECDFSSPATVEYRREETVNGELEVQKWPVTPYVIVVRSNHSDYLAFKLYVDGQLVRIMTIAPGTQRQTVGIRDSGEIKQFQFSLPVLLSGSHHPEVDKVGTIECVCYAGPLVLKHHRPYDHDDPPKKTQFMTASKKHNFEATKGEELLVTTLPGKVMSSSRFHATNNLIRIVQPRIWLSSLIVKYCTHETLLQKGILHVEPAKERSRTTHLDKSPKEQEPTDVDLDDSSDESESSVPDLNEYQNEPHLSDTGENNEVLEKTNMEFECTASSSLTSDEIRTPAEVPMEQELADCVDTDQSKNQAGAVKDDAWTSAEIPMEQEPANHVDTDHSEHQTDAVKDEDLLSDNTTSIFPKKSKQIVSYSHKVELQTPGHEYSAHEQMQSRVFYPKQCAMKKEVLSNSRDAVEKHSPMRSSDKAPYSAQTHKQTQSHVIDPKQYAMKKEVLSNSTNAVNEDNSQMRSSHKAPYSAQEAEGQFDVINLKEYSLKKEDLCNNTSVIWVENSPQVLNSSAKAKCENPISRQAQGHPSIIDPEKYAVKKEKLSNRRDIIWEEHSTPSRRLPQKQEPKTPDVQFIGMFRMQPLSSENPDILVYEQVPEMIELDQSIAESSEQDVIFLD